MLDVAVQAQTTVPIPASQGMGHLVLALEKQISVAPGAHSVGANVVSHAAPASVSSGGCCGDAMLAAVRLP